MLVICEECQREGGSHAKGSQYAVWLRYANPTYGL